MGAPGFFGKVTSHGDFVARRLPAEFVQAWDPWLQAGIQASRSELGDAWLGIYLSSPLWRFLLAPGVCGPQAWAGVLMPSVDRVGRHFPLTLAGPIAPQSLLDWMAQSGPWYTQLETLALSSLQEGFALEDFDGWLLNLTAPGPFAEPAEPGPVTALASLAQLPQALPALGRRLADAGLAGQSLWWSEGSQRVTPCLVQCSGLPLATSFAALLDGAWVERGV